MEAKLKEYRALRRRKELIDNTKEKLEKTKEKFVDLFVPKIFKDMDKDKKEEEVLLLEDEEPTPKSMILLQPEEEIDVTSEVSEADSEVLKEEIQESWSYFITKWTIYVIIWVSLYIFFLKQGFGAVFFVISALVGICLNTRTRRKKKGEVSAYSVFNQNCVSIDGTLKAEDLQRQMLYGVAGIR